MSGRVGDFVFRVIGCPSRYITLLSVPVPAVIVTVVVIDSI